MDFNLDGDSLPGAVGSSEGAFASLLGSGTPATASAARKGREPSAFDVLLSGDSEKKKGPSSIDSAGVGESVRLSERRGSKGILRALHCCR